MKVINCEDIEKKVADICIEASLDLPKDVENCIRKSIEKESSPRAKNFLEQYIENAEIARNERLPICQDTGVAVFFVELGQDAKIEGGLLPDAIEHGVEKGYKDGYLRKSIVDDPIFERKNTGTNTPPVIHMDIVPGDGLKIVLAPKGGGSENMSALAMLKPSDGREGVIDFVVSSVVKAGGNPCPPTVVGVGVGGNFEMSAILAKKALLREINQPSPNPDYAALEKEILEKINASGVGAQGLGGDITAFAVHVEYYPCHIASLPVAVNLNCHAARHKEIVF
jgi:fumarate hydratase subunit alpha